jgi:O-antigen biosynthesis protein WbqP
MDRMIKRLFDIVVASAGLLITAPVCVFIVGLIRLTSTGPAFFRQSRVGLSGDVFSILKFRTMHHGTANRPTHEIAATQVTGVGRLLRATKLDEVPQLWNVLRGDMSLVGPRPCLPQQIELVRLRQANGVLQVPPGITGLAQVIGIDMSVPRRLAAIDALYVRNRSFGLDLRIILATLGLAPFKSPRGKRSRGLVSRGPVAKLAP